MKIGVIIPDRNDRPKFTENCFRMMEKQTVKIDIIEHVNYIPKNDDCDITPRYRYGYDALRNKGLDIIALIENDDWYSPDYLEIMINKWVELGKPDIIGTNSTIYYHLGLHKYFTMYHDLRASAMNTLLKPDLDFPWCIDIEPYTDMHLWKTLQGYAIKPHKLISIGMKHGIGKCGGRSHVDGLRRFVNEGLSLLQENLDKESYEFYTSICKNWEVLHH